MLGNFNLGKLDGIILIDKPVGISSAGVVRKIKEFEGVDKIGHAGTLDPFATGLLICCINRATRLARFFLESDKEYEGVLRLGVDTNTQDSTGAVVRKMEFDHVKLQDILELISRFKGAIYQKPPFFSALKHKGVSLYEFARRGVYIDKAPRRVFIHDFTIVDFRLPEIFFKIRCSSGTYIRTICADIGGLLGCGGHLKSLRRIASGIFTITQAHKLANLFSEDSNGELSEYMLSMVKALDFLPSYMADQILVKKIRNGVKLERCDFLNGFSAKGSFNSDDKLFKVVNIKGDLIAVLGVSNKLSRCTYFCVF